MRDHARAQTSTQQREYAKHRAIRGDEQHSGNSFVAVRAAEDERGERNTTPNASSHSSKLLLQVTTKDEFFADAGRDAENQEQHHLETGRGRQLLGNVPDFLWVN